jgi:hypothetical protein
MIAVLSSNEILPIFHSGMYTKGRAGQDHLTAALKADAIPEGSSEGVQFIEIGGRAPTAYFQLRSARLV